MNEFENQTDYHMVQPENDIDQSMDAEEQPERSAFDEEDAEMINTSSSVSKRKSKVKSNQKDIEKDKMQWIERSRSRSLDG